MSPIWAAAHFRVRLNLRWMLKAKKKFLLSTYNIFDEKNYFGTLRASSLIPKATFIVKEGHYRFYRENWFEGKYFCTLHNSYKAYAEKPHGIGESFWINHQSNNYLLKPGGLFREKTAFDFQLFNNDHLCGTIVENPTRFILDIKFEVELPQIIKCFIFWLGYRTWVCVRGWSHAPGMARIFSRF